MRQRRRFRGRNCGNGFVIGAAYWTDLFRRPVFGAVNVGLLFALSEFVVAWLIAFVYSRHASRHFDAIAVEISRNVAGGAR